MQTANSLVLVWPTDDDPTSDQYTDSVELVSATLNNCLARVAVYVPGLENSAV